MSPLRPWVLSVLLVVGCSSSMPAEPETPPAPPEPVAPAEPAPAVRRAVPEGHLRREDVLAVLSEGPPVFLQKIDVEASVDRAGKFRGWVVMAIRDPALAAGGIQTGDVVMSVNGKAVQDPYEFFDVFQSLAFAPELTFAIERGKERRDVRFPIDDDPSAPPLPRPTVTASPAPRADAAGDARKPARTLGASGDKAPR